MSRIVASYLGKQSRSSNTRPLAWALNPPRRMVEEESFQVITHFLPSFQPPVNLAESYTRCAIYPNPTPDELTIHETNGIKVHHCTPKSLSHGLFGIFQ